MATLALHGGPKAIPQPLPKGGHGVELMGEEEVAAAARVIRSKNLFRFSPGAEECTRFEEEAAAFLGVKHALFVTTGTAGLVCALSGLGIGPGDEVIVPGYTYIATAAAVCTVGAVPVIAEIDDSLGLDPADVAEKITPRTRAVIPVHMQGVPARLGALREVAANAGVAILEDCCQAAGSAYHGEKTGSRAAAGAWSLNYFKAITCGEGGVFFTNDDAVFERGLLQSDPAMPMWKKPGEEGARVWTAPPFSRECYRGNEITAAIARVQLQKLPRVLAHTRARKKTLLSRLDPAPACYVRQHVEDPEGDNGFSFAMIARDEATGRAMAEALEAEGLEIGSAYNAGGFPDRHIYAYWDSILGKTGATGRNYPWGDPAYTGDVEYSRDMCPRTLSILERALRLPIHMNLTAEHMGWIAEAINKVDRALA